ncbi:glycosyltransferase [Acetobacter sp. TBRC 12305]|uniref:Glycosyltransferase n=1 Tax=Acetobacter garciniae TaxID=2817435 RepID=A0A939HGB7_9PROT|nr:glycosyltransferase [Acetobacter garciniae]MBO1323878.1 glycosyltransferase [Acetobacter garciniae]MBX0343567.1 glycosyltransferase [Acetobacter garciniae]
MSIASDTDIMHLLRSKVILAEPQFLAWPPPWVGHIPFAFWLMESSRPTCMVELGTHTGNSYCAFLQAAIACDLPIKSYAVDTWEGDPHAGYYGNEVYDELSAYHNPLYGAISCLMRMTFDQALDYFSDGSIDLLHIDGLHTYDAVKNDFTKWLPKMSRRGIILLHDINVRERGFGVWKLWEEISVQYPAFSFDHSNGLGMVYVGSEPMPENIRWLIMDVAVNSERLAVVRRFFSRLGAGLFDRAWSQERANLLSRAMDENQRFSDMVVERDNRLKPLYEEVERLNTLLNDATAAVHHANDMVVERDNRLEPLYKEVERLTTLYKKAEATYPIRLKILQNDVKKYTSEISERDDRLSILYPEIERLNAAVKDLEIQLHAVYASSSWRITAWMRWCKTSIRTGLLKFRFIKRIMRPLLNEVIRRPNRLPKRIIFMLACFYKLGVRGTWRHLIQIVDLPRHNESAATVVLKEENSEKKGRNIWSSKEPLPVYESWLAVNRLSRGAIDNICASLGERKGRTPKISLITPVYNTDPVFFEELLESVLAQVYDDWELCLVDDCSSAPYVTAMLERAIARDSRIKTTRLEKNGGISVATNAGVEMASGEIVAFLDHDDLITPDCLAELAIYYADHPDADIVYSDDDKIDTKGHRYAPQFKPDWAPILLLSFMYISHVFSVRRSLFVELGGFRKSFDGSQDYDFALRAAEKARHVGHIPKILYHWRAAPGSTAVSADNKPASIEAGRRAVLEAMKRRGYSDVRVIHPDWAAKARCGIFELIFPDDGPSVTIVIPTKNQVDFLRTCINSLVKTTYRNYNILIVDNESDDPEAIAYLESLTLAPHIRVVCIPSPEGGFNFANLNNRAVQEYCTTEYILFLNNDTKVISPGWLSQMMGYGQMPGVGAVGARLYFEDNTVQHAGVVHGYHEGLVGHAFRNIPRHDWGYMGFVRTSREYSAVTAACMLTSRTLFEELGGFDELNFPVSYNDVDYCYRVVISNRSCVYCATAELFHFESKTRGYKYNPHERINFRRIYGNWYDRWYNPNLSLENERFEPAAVCLQSRRNNPVNVVMVTHNLNYEGAPSVLMDLTVGLIKRGNIHAKILSLRDGPLREVYEAEGIPVHIMSRSPLHDVHDAATLARSCEDYGALLKQLGAEVVVANTLQNFWAVIAATYVGLPSILCQHESEAWESYFDYLPEAIRFYAYNAFAEAYRVIYVADATRRAWHKLDSQGTFKLVRHGIPPARLAEMVSRWDRAQARNLLNLGNREVAIVVVGTLCARKSQLDIIEAFSWLEEKTQDKIRIFLVGANGEPAYTDVITSRINSLPSSAANRIVLTGPTSDPFIYYAAADIAVCTSRIESAPRVIVEAMAFGLPIITTPVFGIPEQVYENVNALFYPPGDVEELAILMANLVEDDALRQKLATKSRAVLDSQPSFADMVEEYDKIIQQAADLEVVSSKIRQDMLL